MGWMPAFIRRPLGLAARPLLSRRGLEGDAALNYAAVRAEMLLRDQAHRLRLRRMELRPTRRKPGIVVSLTSIPPRLGELPLVIKCMLRQTMPPDRIVLWLSEEYRARSLGTLSRSDVPAELRKLERRGLEIRWTEDLGSYGKLIPALRQFPEEIIITVDDDVYYSRRTVESLYKAYLEHGGGNIYCRRSRIIERRGAGSYAADRKVWSSKMNAERLLALGVGGVLYPPGAFTDEVFNRKAFTELAPHEDDCWFTVMAMLNGRRVFQVDAKEISGLPNRNREALLKITKASGEREGFNRQITALIRHYGLEL